MQAVLADKTNWRYAQRSGRSLDLNQRGWIYYLKCKTVSNSCSSNLASSIQLLTESEKISIDYPVQQYLDKLASLNFDKQQIICSKLLGIKGQYLIFEQGVINIRKFGGYQIKLSY